MGILLVILVSLSSTLLAQNVEIDYNSVAKLNNINDTIVITDPPKFACGEDGLNHFIKSHLQLPINKMEMNNRPIYLSFLILKDGKVDGISVVKGVNTIYDLEAVRLCKIMPRWKPALNNGKPVVVKVTLPLALNK